MPYHKYRLTITPEMLDIAIHAPFSLQELESVKFHYNLTDYGLRLLTNKASRSAIGLHQAAIQEYPSCMKVSR